MDRHCAAYHSLSNTAIDYRCQIYLRPVDRISLRANKDVFICLALPPRLNNLRCHCSHKHRLILMQESPVLVNTMQFMRHLLIIWVCLANEPLDRFIIVVMLVCCIFQSHHVLCEWLPVACEVCKKEFARREVINHSVNCYTMQYNATDYDLLKEAQRHILH